MSGLALLAVVTVLSGNWEFHKTLDANSNAVEDAWRMVCVPHDWAVDQPFVPSSGNGLSGILPWRGAGEYRRTFTLSDEDRDNLHMDGRAYLEFDGVMDCGDVFLNGQRVGGGTYGYLGYKLDVTKVVRPDATNEVLVKVTTQKRQSRWCPGGGISPDVRLRVCPHPHPIPDTLTIRVERLSGRMANMVATFETPWGSETKRWTVESPRLWSPEDPFLYELDIYGLKFPYGIRDVRFDAGKGFFLNGKRVQLKGVNLHSGLGPLSIAFDISVMKRQLLAMKAMGVNAIRTNHNCSSPQLLDLCDKMGFLVWDECFDTWNEYAGRFQNDDLEDCVSDCLRRFVRRDRNHPCVVVWSIENEASAATGNSGGVTGESSRLFRDAVLGEDTTRPVVIGECGDTFLPPPEWRTDCQPVGTCGTPVSLKLSVDPYQPDDPQSLRFLWVDVVDAKGVRDPLAEPTVRFSVAGPGEIVAAGNPDWHSAESFRDFSAVPLRLGKALVIVRRTGEGAITVRAESEGLNAATYDFGGVIRVDKGPDAFERAQQAVRAAKTAQPNETWTVVVPAGEYRRSATLRFGAEDSGRPGASVIWKADGAILRGGVDVGPWEDVGDGVVSAPIPTGADGRPLALDMLFVNGARASRSVLPKYRGSFKIPGGVEDSRYELVATNLEGNVTYAREYTRLNEDAAAVLDAVSPDELGDVQMQVRLDWTQARRRIAGWDMSRREVFTEAFGGPNRNGKYRWGPRAAIRLENLRSAFVDPGDWFYDRKAGRIFYRLRENENTSTLKAVAPARRLSELLFLDGTHDVRFEGLEFAYSDAPQGGIADDPLKNNQTYRSQSARTSDAAVELRFAERVEFRRCAVRHTGNYAFRIADGCRHVSLRRCETWDTGAGGVWIGSAEMHPPGGRLCRRILEPTEPESCAFNVIEDCRLRHGGRFNPEGTAIFVTHASDCRIEHNEIDDWYYSGITVGYTWGYEGSVAQRNLIAYNRISRLGQHELSDMGGIYTLATSYGTVVRNNIITDVFGYDAAAWGLYADEGSEGIVFENNVISHTECGGINQHFGSGCIFRSNIIAYNEVRGCLSMSRREAFGVPSQVHVTGNIFYTHKGPLACRGAMEVDGVWAHNVWWKEGGPASDDFDGRSADWFLASGRAYGDVVADPLFVDAKNGDFRLRSESPALKLGFREWDFSQAGPRCCFDRP